MGGEKEFRCRRGCSEEGNDDPAENEITVLIPTWSHQVDQFPLTGPRGRTTGVTAFLRATILFQGLQVLSNGVDLMVGEYALL